MIDDLTMDKWRSLATEVSAMTTRAREDPAYLATLDLGDLTEKKHDAGESADTLLMRACATRIMPPEFGWNVVQALGGAAHLLLVRIIEPDDDAPRELDRISGQARVSGAAAE